jgi:long-chain acyl-CoA synthetase
MLEQVETLGELRKLIAGADEDEEQPVSSAGSANAPVLPPAEAAAPADAPLASKAAAATRAAAAAPELAGVESLHAKQARERFVFPSWPWWKPVEWARIAFFELVGLPLTWVLAAPRVSRAQTPPPQEPMLIVANHVSSYDAALVQYSLTPRMRRHMAIAMSGAMLVDFRHWRNPKKPGSKGIYLFGPPAYFLVTAFFNVFPLHRSRDFQTSFFHAGKALDRGYNVMVFPEGELSPDGRLKQFRPGIGLLVKQSAAPVLPVGLRGVGELKMAGRGWFRSGKIEVCIGKPIRFAPEETEAAITERLHDEVGKLLGETGTGGLRD